MTTETIKKELINKIMSLDDIYYLKKITQILDEYINTDKKSKFGYGKGTFTYVADDFDEPLEEFREYM